MNQSYFYLKMKEHKLKVPYTGKERRVRILLPKDYEKDTDRSYPVVYFHDGQNVFNSKESFIGHSWKIIPAIKRNPDISRMIVVAIDNDGMGRMNEYAAWKFQESPIPEQQFGGKGVEYAESVMEVVKPFIDETYRTKADCQHTAMIGSSLGGNIPSLSVWNTKTKLVAWAFFHLQTGSTKKPLTAISSARNYRLTSASSSM
ncbi:putative alpha/beta superfamily hydrolase [Streptococcus pneumoniae]|nr:putative alpha/beta superfamily hydrolase [Streptococcus pneumoniae]VSH24432.1 putative alpha/beta superfamily hydrolase [Streptococcus pneumoniae]